MSHLLQKYLSVPSDITPSRLVNLISRNATFDNVVINFVKTFLFGLFVSYLRRFIAYLYHKTEKCLFPTAYIHITDPASLWIQSYMSQEPYVQSQIRDFQLLTDEWRNVRKRGGDTLMATKGNVKVGEQNATWQGKDILGQILPIYTQQIRIVFEGHYLWISRRHYYYAGTASRSEDHYRVRTFVWQRSVLKNFLVAAHKAFHAKDESEIHIFHALRIKSAWSKPITRPSRPWDSVILPPGMKEDLLGDVERFLSDKEISWYAARGIPHRRGYLLHGKPGAGKSTLVTAIASKLRLDIYIINPNQRGMDDAKISKLFRSCPARSILLVEDIDCIFSRNRGRQQLGIQVDEGGMEGNEEERDDEEVPQSAVEQPGGGGKHDLAPSTVTLSGLLNAIDGVSSQEGCILIASTNHVNRLDPALSRAGRFDVHIPFHHALPSQARQLFIHFYPLAEFLKPADDIYDALTAVEKEKHSLDLSAQDDIDKLADVFTTSIFDALKTQPKLGSDTSLSEKRLESGAKEEKDNKGVSMAALQGYLMGYKDDPISAAENADEWVKSLEVKEGIRGLQSLKSPKTVPPTPVALSAAKEE